ncbi:MAG: YggS family pyridoxal phosphate-dependent enzyme [Duncaniella sp.]|nr:YggS family pyridoxal phosphate-dependent enzyme [Bacteroides sp.]MDE6066369.1 YggS family pyridoxal phosphate-dependent enzyme [Duncaniella sp.]
MGVRDRLTRLNGSVPEGVELVAVSKFHPVEALREAYDAGQRIFGESRANELCDKAKVMPEDVRWHFIGHLQTNKVRQILPHVTLIHSVDSERLLRLIDSEASRLGRKVQVLLQLHVAREETKYGFTPDELLSLLTPDLLAHLPSVEVAGVMGMASNVDDEERIRSDFRTIRSVFDMLRDGIMSDVPGFKIVSMGMSHDWPLAVDEGANMIRVGTTIFGEREY